MDLTLLWSVLIPTYLHDYLYAITAIDFNYI